jgi:hypothetical protein
MKNRTQRNRQARIDRMDQITKTLCKIADETGYLNLKDIAYDVRVWNDTINRKWN